MSAAGIEDAEEVVLDAVLALLTAAGAEPITLGEAQQLGEAALPDTYTEVTISPRAGGRNRSTASSDAQGWRVTTRAVARLEANARAVRKDATDALRFARLDLPGARSTPLQLETATVIDRDDGSWFSGLTRWTFVTRTRTRPVPTP